MAAGRIGVPHFHVILGLDPRTQKERRVARDRFCAGSSGQAGG